MLIVILGSTFQIANTMALYRDTHEFSELAALWVNDLGIN